MPRSKPPAVDPHPPLAAQTVAATAAVRDCLTPDFVRAVLTPALANYRARKLTIEVVVLSVVELLLRGLPSLGVLVRRLRLGTLTSVAAVDVTAQAFYQRLEALPHTLWVTLLQHVVRTLAPAAPLDPARAHLARFATGLYALDDTTLDAVVRKSDTFVRPATSALYQPLGGKLGCVVDLRTGLFRAVAYDSDPTSPERVRLETLVAPLPAGALVVLDRGYFAFDLFDALSRRFLYFVTRMKENVAWQVAHTFVDTPYYTDHLVWLGGDYNDRMTWPVRLVGVARPDGTWWRYVTNVWDPAVLDPLQLVALYQARWSIERAFAAIKRALGLHALHPCQVNGLLIQVWSTLLLYQVLQHLRSAVAAALAWPHDEVSWPKLMDAITIYAEVPPARTLRAWLEQNATKLELQVRQPERRKRVVFSRAALAALRTPIAPLPLATIQPKRPRRRPSRVKDRPSERYFADFFAAPTQAFS